MIRASDEFKKKLKNTLEITDGWIQNGVIVAHKEYFQMFVSCYTGLQKLLKSKKNPILLNQKQRMNLTKKYTTGYKKRQDKTL